MDNSLKYWKMRLETWQKLKKSLGDNLSIFIIENDDASKEFSPFWKSLSLIEGFLKI